MFLLFASYQITISHWQFQVKTFAYRIELSYSCFKTVLSEKAMLHFKFIQPFGIVFPVFQVYGPFTAFHSSRISYLPFHLPERQVQS